MVRQREDAGVARQENEWEDLPDVPKVELDDLHAVAISSVSDLNRDCGISLR